jgi:hypothetical protein
MGAWGSLVLRSLFGSSEPSVADVLIPVAALVLLVAFSIGRFARGSARP